MQLMDFLKIIWGYFKEMWTVIALIITYFILIEYSLKTVYRNSAILIKMSVVHSSVLGLGCEKQNS